MTVEAAFAVGTLVVVLAVVLAAMGAVVLQLRCVDAAIEAARLGARGDVDGARRAAERLLPAGAEVGVEVRGDDVVVHVRAAPLGSALPGLRVGAEALAAREPSPVAPAEGPDPLPGGPGTDVGAEPASVPRSAPEAGSDAAPEAGSDAAPDAGPAAVSDAVSDAAPRTTTGGPR
ncbi:TadE family type IV pilus minor pilin [Actinomycetospora aeridis]|uniref:TadE family type IV pilus minor pilin n=1 Tax=Actinomycetospora aeridis TaxID=3129231 RepID=A0ABU8N250_9PSEU